MNRTQFFTDSIAASLREVAEQLSFELPVVGQINDPLPEHARLEVRCENIEELIPGNHTYRLDCQVVLNLSAAAMTAEQVETTLEAASAVCRAALSEPDWRMQPLRDPRGEGDEEYREAPFIVLDLVTEVAPPEVSGVNYLGVLAFRAFIQF